MDIVTPCARSAQQPQALVDACPECCINVEPPSSVYATDTGWLTNHVCVDCGHAWSTNWKD